MINITNNYIENYSKLGNFVDGFASVIRSYGLSGFIDKTGEEKIPCQFSSVHNFSEGLA